LSWQICTSHHSPLPTPITQSVDCSARMNDRDQNNNANKWKTCSVDRDSDDNNNGRRRTSGAALSSQTRIVAGLRRASTSELRQHYDFNACFGRPSAKRPPALTNQSAANYFPTPRWRFSCPKLRRQWQACTSPAVTNSETTLQHQASARCCRPHTMRSARPPS
jgi:hypothetical protein